MQAALSVCGATTDGSEHADRRDLLLCVDSGHRPAHRYVPFTHSGDFAYQLPTWGCICWWSSLHGTGPRVDLGQQRVRAHLSFKVDSGEKPRCKRATSGHTADDWESPRAALFNPRWVYASLRPIFSNSFCCTSLAVLASVASEIQAAESKWLDTLPPTNERDPLAAPASDVPPSNT